MTMHYFRYAMVFGVFTGSLYSMEIVQDENEEAVQEQSSSKKRGRQEITPDLGERASSAELIALDVLAGLGGLSPAAPVRYKIPKHIYNARMAKLKEQWAYFFGIIPFNHMDFARDLRKITDKPSYYKEAIETEMLKVPSVKDTFSRRANGKCYFLDSPELFCAALMFADLIPVPSAEFNGKVVERKVAQFARLSEADCTDLSFLDYLDKCRDQSGFLYLCKALGNRPPLTLAKVTTSTKREKIGQSKKSSKN